MKYINLALLFILTPLLSACSAGSGKSGWGLGSSLFKGFYEGASQSGDATFGPFVFVGAVAAFIGLVVAWVFRERVAGLGMIVSGLALGAAAVAMQEIMTTVLIVGGIVTALSLLLWFTNEAWRKKVRKHAAQLFCEGKVEEAKEVERDANPELDKALKKKEKMK